MMKILFLAAAAAAPASSSSSSSSSSPMPSPSVKIIEAELDHFHQAAAEARAEDYFRHFTKDAVFLGTDAGERWSVEEFRTYASPHFQKGKGWTYVPMKRYVSLNPQETVAWFDEILKSESYGTARGTGVLLREGSSWKIAQYHLTFPMPNSLAKKFTQEIKAFEAQTPPAPEPRKKK